MKEHTKELSVHHQDGAAFEIRVRSHRLMVDQPAGSGGNDEGPTPTDLFDASVASCAAFYGRTFLHRRGLPDHVDVRARWRIESRPDRVGTIMLDIEAPGVPVDRCEAFERALRGCLVHNTIERGCDVQVAMASCAEARSS